MHRLCHGRARGGLSAESPQRKKPRRFGRGYLPGCRDVSETGVSVAASDGLFFLAEIAEVVPFGRRHRPVSDVPLHPVNRPSLPQSLHREFVSEIMQAGTELGLLGVVPEQVCSGAIVSLFRLVPEDVWRAIGCNRPIGTAG